MAKARRTVLVSGMIAAVPRQGGATWAVLQYLLGLRRLGHDVYFVEPIEKSALQPPGAPLAESANAAYFRQVVQEFALEGRAALLLAGTEETVGVGFDRLHELTGRADVLLNIAGLLTEERLTAHPPVRVYLDLDPAFSQLWQATQHIDMRFDGHTHFVTVGQAIGEADCKVPMCGRAWITTLQPVVLSEWPVAEDITYDGLTTVANWRGYGSIEHDGVVYGQKAHSLRRFIGLPTLTPIRFMLALAIHADERPDLAALARKRWHRLDPAVVAGTPAAYRRFIQASW